MQRDWPASGGPLLSGQWVLHHPQTESPWRIHLSPLFWHADVPGWTASHQIWCAGRYRLRKSRRSKDTALLDTNADREWLRCRTIVHNCTLHVLMEGGHHVAWGGGNRPFQVGERVPSSWLDRRPWLSEWTPRRGAFPVLCTFPGAGVLRRSYRWWIFLLWTGTGILGRHVKQVSEVWLAGPERRPSPQCSVMICPYSCCSHRGRLCFCTRWLL